MLEAVEVSKKYWDRSSGRQYDVLQSCSLQIAAGEAVGMMGPSGCGKSTLARVLLRLLPTDSGRIIFQTQDVTQLSQKQLKPFRQQVQFISQRPESFFDPLRNWVPACVNRCRYLICLTAARLSKPHWPQSNCHLPCWTVIRIRSAAAKYSA